MVASCTPCDASETVSRSGHFVALMRLRNSVSSASGTFTLKGRRAVLSLPVCFATVGVISSLLLIEFVSWSEGRNTSAEHQVREWTLLYAHDHLTLPCTLIAPGA